MQPLAAWLVARPQNGVIGLAATLLVPFINVFSGIFMALLVLKNGARVAVLQAGIAAALLAVVSLVTGTTAVQVAIFALVVWGPALIVAAILAKTRSLTLTLQVMALAIIAIAVVIFGFVDDVVAFAEPLTTFFLEVYRSGGLGAQADALASRPVEFAEELLRVALWVNWITWVLYLLFGYRFYRHATESGPVYGKFHDLDFGYVLAIGMAIALVV
ncbi:MAG: hypothetical protein QNJ23_11650, partial [Woeseiaceae bacterium]|nr:hypothetical protein [Woeseiaceae bacterium]